ncbi:MAG: hypothetical protein Q4F88_00385 [Eubacteriales bacterium]|nr:hypothetical protein [Eubacteriales bacterium]
MNNKNKKIKKNNIKNFILLFFIFFVVNINFFSFCSDLIRPNQENAIAITIEESEEEITHQKYKSIIRQSGTDINIQNHNFLSTIYDIYNNYDYYKNKTIHLEGLISKYESNDGRIRSYVIYRNGPGCCEGDTWAGFLLDFDNNDNLTFKQGDWARVSGKINIVNDNGNSYFYLKIKDISLVSDSYRKQEVVYWEGY